MDSHHVARLLAVGRVGVGVVLLAVPGAAVRAVGVEPRPGSCLLARAAGIRDLALGVGALRALSQGRGGRAWVQAGAACDAVDAALLATSRGDLGTTVTLAGIAVASSAAALGARAAADLED